jgi:hypothetical protein
MRRDADDRRGARAGRDGVAGHEFRGAHPAAVRGAEGLVERDMPRVAAEVEPLARDDQERVAVGRGEGLEVSAAPVARVEGDLGAGLGGETARWSGRLAKATLDRFAKSCRAGDVVQAKSISSREQGSRLLKAANQL